MKSPIEVTTGLLSDVVCHDLTLPVLPPVRVPCNVLDLGNVSMLSRVGRHVFQTSKEDDVARNMTDCVELHEPPCLILTYKQPYELANKNM